MQDGDENLGNTILLLVGIITQAYKDAKRQNCVWYEKETAINFLESQTCKEYVDFICAYYELPNTVLERNIKEVVNISKDVIK